MSKLFWDALGRFLYQDLVRSSAAAANPFMTVFEDSCSPGMKILMREVLLQFLVKGSCSGPGEIF